MTRISKAVSWTLLLALLLPAAVVLAAARPVVVDVARQRLLAPLDWYDGTVVGRQAVKLSAEVEGRLLSVAEVGTRLAAGDAVARLDDSLLQQALVERRADIARTRARLEFLDKEARRLQRLARQNNAAQSQLEQTVADRAAAEGDLEAARARERQALERLRRTTLRAPFAAVVTQRLLQPGEWADAGAAIVELVDPDDLEAQVRVARAALAVLQPGAGVRVQGGGGGGGAEGRVRVLVPVAEPPSRLYELRVDLPPGDWTAGEALRVAVPAAAPRRVLSVPRDALVIRRTAIYVFRVGEDGTAQRVEVRTGVADGRYIEVQGELADGDRVVVRGGERLRDGDPVEVREADAGP